jgi:NAD-dependent deacetylase sirtuin 2
MVFSVVPILCPHLPGLEVCLALPSVSAERALPCGTCQSTEENWICVSCGGVFCSRYVSGHALAHHEAKAGHSVAVSLSDLSIWCFSCDAYVHADDRVRAIQQHIHRGFFGESSGAYASSSQVVTVADKKEEEKEEEKEEVAEASSLIDRLVESISELGLGSDKAEPGPGPVLSAPTLEAVAEFLNSERCKRVVVLTGAGVSTSAGIPDFRTPGTGLYSNLQRFNLPSPQSVFTLPFFRTNPRPFFELSKEIFPSQFKPTLGHRFVKELERKGKLKRCFTQNIDTLEREAKIDPRLVVEAHGSFASSSCIDCRAAFDHDLMKELILSGKAAEEAPSCSRCGGLCKPDITFFGEELPKKFFETVKADFDRGAEDSVDLLIVMGTSLMVQPFASLPEYVHERTPRLLVNMEVAGQGMFDFEGTRDVFAKGPIDDTVQKLCDLMKWEI